MLPIGLLLFRQCIGQRVTDIEAPSVIFRSSLASRVFAVCASAKLPTSYLLSGGGPCNWLPSNTKLLQNLKLLCFKNCAFHAFFLENVLLFWKLRGCKFLLEVRQQRTLWGIIFGKKSGQMVDQFACQLWPENSYSGSSASSGCKLYKDGAFRNRKAA